MVNNKFEVHFLNKKYLKPLRSFRPSNCLKNIQLILRSKILYRKETSYFYICSIFKIKNAFKPCNKDFGQTIF